MDCSLPGSSVHGDSPGKNAGVGCHSFLQGIFPTQGLNPGLPHCRWILYQLNHQGSSREGIKTQPFNCKLIQPLWKIVWRFLKKLGITVPYHPTIPLLDIHPEKTIIEKDTCTPVFLPGESQGWGSLVGCHLWGRTESDMTATKQRTQNKRVDCDSFPAEFPVTCRVDGAW